MQALNLMLSIKHYNERVSFICLCSQLDASIKNKILDNVYNIGVLLYEYQINFTLNSLKWPDSSCLRLFSPWLIDEENIINVLYLDCDILCKGDLTPLFNFPNSFLTMTTEIAGNTVIKKPDPNNFNIYCNSGVAKLNLPAFRQYYDFENFVKFFLQKNQDFGYPDQDFLNFCIPPEKITKINGLIWNFQPYELLGSHCFADTLNRSKLLHFSWQRPWNPGCRFIEYFDLYLQCSFYEPLINIVRNAKAQRMSYEFQVYLQNKINGGVK